VGLKRGGGRGYMSNCNPFQPYNLEDWSCSERNARSSAIQVRGSGTTSMTRHNAQGLESSIKSPWIFVWACESSPTDSHPLSSAADSCPIRSEDNQSSRPGVYTSAEVRKGNNSSVNSYQNESLRGKSDCASPPGAMLIFRTIPPWAGGSKTTLSKRAQMGPS